MFILCDFHLWNGWENSYLLTRKTNTHTLGNLLQQCLATTTTVGVQGQLSPAVVATTMTCEKKSSILVWGGTYTSKRIYPLTEEEKKMLARSSIKKNTKYKFLG